MNVWHTVLHNNEPRKPTTRTGIKTDWTQIKKGTKYLLTVPSRYNTIAKGNLAGARPWWTLKCPDVECGMLGQLGGQSFSQTTASVAQRGAGGVPGGHAADAGRCDRPLSGRLRRLRYLSALHWASTAGNHTPRSPQNARCAVPDRRLKPSGADKTHSALAKMCCRPPERRLVRAARRANGSHDYHPEYPGECHSHSLRPRIRKVTMVTGPTLCQWCKRSQLTSHDEIDNLRPHSWRICGECHFFWGRHPGAATTHLMASLGQVRCFNNDGPP